MPSGPKKRRAKKRKEEAATAASEKSENEAALAPSLKEAESSGMQSTDSVTVVFEEPTVVLPKKTVLLDNILAPEVVDLKRKDTEESIKENTLPSEIHSSVQSLNVAEPLVSSLADETDAIATDETELLQDEGRSIMVSNAFSVTMDNAMITLTTEICDLDSVECLNAENAVLSNIDAAEEQKTLEHKEDTAVEKIQNLVTHKNGAAVENKKTSAPNALEKTEEAVQLHLVAALKIMLNEGDALEKSKETEQLDVVKISSEAVTENQETAASNEVDAPENSVAVQLDDVEAAVKETVNLEGVNHIEKNTLEAVALRGKCETIPNNLETVIAAKAAVGIIYQTHDAVSSELVTPGVGKQLKEVKEMVVDVLNRLNAIDAMLHRN